jgi:hypothetical protein
MEEINFHIAFGIHLPISSAAQSYRKMMESNKIAVVCRKTTSNPLILLNVVQSVMLPRDALSFFPSLVCNDDTIATSRN